MAMAPGRLRTPGKRVHSEPTRRPIVRSGALELAGAKRSIRGSLLRSTNSERERGRACCLLGESAPPSAAGPALRPRVSQAGGSQWASTKCGSVPTPKEVIPKSTSCVLRGSSNRMERRLLTSAVWALSKGPQGPQTRPTRWTTILRWRWELRLRYQV